MLKKAFLVLIFILTVFVLLWFWNTSQNQQTIVSVDLEEDQIEPQFDISYTNADASWIQVTSPKPGASIDSPLKLIGEAKGNWFFEADAPVMLVDWDGRIIAESYISATKDWMTTEVIPFTGELSFELDEQSAVYNRGWVIFQNDNPSGLPEQSRAVEIPIQFNASMLES